MRPSVSVVLALSSAASAALLEARACGDVCARSLKSASTGTAECLARLKTTVQLSVVTSTTTSTILATSTTLLSITATDTQSATATKVVPLTVSTTVAPIIKRKVDQSDTPFALPNQAMACVGEAVFSSACACLGVSATQIVTVTTSGLPGQKTVTQTVWKTDLTTVTTATDVVPTTVATTVLVKTVATTTTSQIVATETVTPKRRGPFRLRVGDGFWGGYGLYVQSRGDDFIYTWDPNAAYTFYLEPGTGYLSNGGNTVMISPAFSYQFNTLKMSDVNTLTGQPLQCAIADNNAVTCTIGQGFDVLAYYYGWVALGNDPGYINAIGSDVITWVAEFI